MNNIKQEILKLPRYNYQSDCPYDCMEEDIEGEYLKLEDILKLLNPKKL